MHRRVVVFSSVLVRRSIGSPTLIGVAPDIHHSAGDEMQGGRGTQHCRSGTSPGYRFHPRESPARY
jgi:hypothetical protein